MSRRQGRAGESVRADVADERHDDPVTGDALDQMLALKAATIETGGGLATTSVSWSSFAKDFDQVFGSAQMCCCTRTSRRTSWQLAKRQTGFGDLRGGTTMRQGYCAARGAAGLRMGRTARTRGRWSMRRSAVQLERS